LPVNDLDPLLGHGRVAGQFGQHFGGTHDHGDRGAQFVADIGGEVAFPLQGAVQAMREAIQFAHQAADFVGGVIGLGEAGFPLFEMWLGGLARHVVDQAQDGLHHLARQPVADQEGEGAHAGGGDQQQQGQLLHVALHVVSVIDEGERPAVDVGAQNAAFSVTNAANGDVFLAGGDGAYAR
jgi:hypothetical protein